MMKIIVESAGCCSELVNQVITAINDEWKTIQYYNNLKSKFEGLGMLDVVRVIDDINEEEHKHVGQLTEVIRQISGDDSDINDIYQGAVEGIEQLTESSKRSLREGYYDVSISDLNDIRDQIDTLIEMMDDVGQSEISPDPNTYGIGTPFIGTRNGYIDLSNLEKYISGEDDEEYDESLSEGVSSFEDHPGWEFVEYNGVGPVESDAYYKYVGDDIQLVIYPPQTFAGDTYDTWEAEIYTDNGSSYQSIDDTRDGFSSFEEAESWINSKLSSSIKTEDTVMKSNGKWTNRGDDGTEHGEFSSKKKADAQRKAMYANGYKG